MATNLLIAFRYPVLMDVTSMVSSILGMQAGNTQSQIGAAIKATADGEPIRRKTDG